jgi:hypothetical protein
VKSVDVPEYVDTPSSIKVGRLKKPQVVRVKVAERHRKFLIRTLLKVERLKLCDSTAACGLIRLSPSDALES